MNFWHFLLYTAISNYIFINCIFFVISMTNKDEDFGGAQYVFPLIFLSTPIRFIYNSRFKFKRQSCICPVCKSGHKTFNQRINEKLGL